MFIVMQKIGDKEPRLYARSTENRILSKTEALKAAEDSAKLCPKTTYVVLEVVAGFTSSLVVAPLSFSE